MPHTFTSAQRTQVGASTLNAFLRFEVTGPDGTWIDVSTALSTPDWINAVQLSDNIDTNTMSMAASLLRDNASTLSLAPLREDSTINRNLLAAYAPILDLVRRWRASVAVVAFGVTPATADWKEVGKGYIDTIDVDDMSPTIQLQGRGEEAPLLDCEILELKTYSVGSTSSMESVIQALINDNWDSNKFGAPPTLYTPVPMNFVMDEYEQDFGNLMSAIQAIASLVGALIRYMYDAAGVNRLTLFIPDRDATLEQWTIAATEYLRIPVNRLDITGVRNYIPVRYVSGAGGAVQVVTSPGSGTSESLNRYGRRSLPIDLAESSQILTATQAQALADAIRSDLEFPILEQRFETFGFWFVQLCDYGRLTANSVHYDNDQYGGVRGFTHDISNGTLRTSVDLGALPAGGYRKWITLASKRFMKPPGGPVGDPMLPPFDCYDNPTGICIQSGKYITVTVNQASSTGNPETLTVEGALNGQMFSGASASLVGQTKTFGPTTSGGNLEFLAWHQQYASGPVGLVTWTSTGGPYTVGLNDGFGDFDYNDIIITVTVSDTAPGAVSTMLPIPTNDTFRWRRLLQFGDNRRVDNTGYTMEVGGPAQNTVEGNVSGTLEGSAWYWFRAGGSILYDVTFDTFMLTPPTRDTVIAAYTGTTRVDGQFMDNVVLLGSNDNYGSGLTSSMSFQVSDKDVYLQAGTKVGSARGLIIVRLTTTAVPAPANDNFASRIVLTGASGSVTEDNVNATVETGEPLSGFGLNVSTIWYEWVAPASNILALRPLIPSIFDYAAVSVYTGSTLATLVRVADVYGSLNFAVVSGTSYKFQVDSASDAGPAIQLGWSTGTAPANDNFANLTVLSGITGNTTVDNSFSTRESGEPTVQGDHTIWFEWTATNAGSTVFDTLSSSPSIDTWLGIYTGSALGALTLVGSNDNFGAGPMSKVTFTAVAGTSYKIRVYTKKSYTYAHTGPITLTWVGV